MAAVDFWAKHAKSDATMSILLAVLAPITFAREHWAAGAVNCTNSDVFLALNWCQQHMAFTTAAFSTYAASTSAKIMPNGVFWQVKK